MGLLIFDCDGVLVDSEALYVEAETAWLARHGVTFERSDYVRRFMGLAPRDWRAQVAEAAVLAGAQRPDDCFFDGLRTHVQAILEERLAAIAGVAETLAGMDRPRCVASSTSTERLEWKLSHTGLAGYFGDGVFSADLVARGKPAPDLFLHAAAAMRAAPRETVVVEDSANGVRAGKAAGMRVIGFCGGGHCLAGHADMLRAAGADAIAHRFNDIPALVDAV